MSSKTQTTTAKEEAKPALVPKLRFPEFRGEEGWKIKSLGDMCRLYQAETIASSEFVADGAYLVYGANGVVGRLGRFNHEHEEVAVSCRGNCGEVHLTKPQSWITGNAMVVSPKTDDLTKRFLYWLLGASDLKPVISGSAQPQITRQGFSPFQISIPSPGEQQKIAECLSSVDELMAAQARKVDALKTHKKGLMQQLFPREGETQPRLRFPEFQNAGEWEPKTLADVVKSFKTGKLDANAMVENGQYRFYTCAKNYYQIDHYAFDGEALLVAGNGAHLGYIHHYIGKFNAYQRTYVLQDFKANVVFLRCLLDRYLPARIQFEKKDGNTPYIVLSTLTEMPLVIPRDPDEQRRIATCLSSLDALITAETQKQEALKTHKKGLMQQLFPSSEEVEA
jgi:type I restriction enzyme S subunit